MQNYLFFKYEAADRGNKALKATHDSEYSIGCIPCLLCKFLVRQFHGNIMDEDNYDGYLLQILGF